METRRHPLLVSLGDFVTDVATTHGAGNGGEGFTVAATHLIAQQATDNCAHANANGAVLSHWRCRRRRSEILPSRSYGSTCDLMHRRLAALGFIANVSGFCGQGCRNRRNRASRVRTVLD